MIEYLKNILNKFLNTSRNKKIAVLILIILYLAIILMATIKVNYVITTPGVFNHTAITDKDDKSYGAVMIDTDNESGNIYTIGVYNHIRVSLFQYLIAKMSYQVDIDEYNIKTDLTSQEEYQRGVILKKNSLLNAVIVAYEAAQTENSSVYINKVFEGVIVSVVGKTSLSNLQVGDLIVKVNDTVVSSFEHFKILRDQVPNESYFQMTVIRDGKEKVINSKKIKHTDTQGNISYVLSIEALPQYKITNASPKFEINEKMESIGSSGGAMLSLAIYNALLEEDITKGKYIAGTGTISIDGKVGDIGGVGQKIVTADIYGVDIFFVNPEDYEEAKAMYDRIKPKFKLIKVETFSQIIDALAGENND